MKELQYLIAKIKYKLRKNDKETISNYFRKTGMVIGKSCNICCNIMVSEPYLINIGDDVTIAGNVTFITHDNSIAKVIPETTDLFGRIKIGHHCFIGSNSTILYGVSIADSVIIAAGSVVTKSIEESHVVVAGNPARIVGTWDSIKAKYLDSALNVRGLTEQEKQDAILNSVLIRK